MHRTIFVPVFLSCLLAASSLTAQWSQATPGSTPPVRRGGMMVYDANQDRLVLAGGVDAMGVPDASLWSWDGNEWHKHLIPVVKTGTKIESLYYDPAQARTLVTVQTSTARLQYAYDRFFSWSVPIRNPPAVRTHFHRALGVPLRISLLGQGETTIFDGANWQAVPNTGAPLNSGVIAYDPARGEMVLFGGVDPVSQALLRDTWVFDTSGPVTGWRKRTVASALPPGSATPGAMVADERSGRLVLVTAAEVWEWDGASWAPSKQPPFRRGNPALGFDAGRGELVLFSGADGGALSSDTWLLKTSNPYCRLTSFGPSCGPRMSGDTVSIPGFLRLNLHAGVRNSMGFLAVGTQALAIPLPQNGCLQLTEFGILYPFPAGSGSTSLLLRIPQNFAGTVRMQMFNVHTPYRKLDIATTNGLRAVCN